MCSVYSGVKKAWQAGGFLNPIDKFDVPLHTLHVDHVGLLSTTAKGYKQLFVVVDGFSKFVWLYPVKNLTTSEVINRLQQKRDTFGNPNRMITDRHAAFTSNDFENFCKENFINHLVITTGVPRGNGQVERINATVCSVLSKMTVDEPAIWYIHVPKLQRFLNSCVNRSTNSTPFELLCGSKMRNEFEDELVKLLEAEIIEEFMDSREGLRANAREQIIKLQAENKRTFNKKRKSPVRYKLGELVAIKRTQFATGLKLHRKYLGPYQVTGVREHDRYDVTKIGIHEGPIITTSAAEFMKPWMQPEDDFSEDDSSESDELSGRPDVGSGADNETN